MGKVSDKERLRHILESIDNIIEFTNDKTLDDFKGEKVLRFAVIKNIEIIGEAANLVSSEFKKKYPSIEWNEMIGMRNVLVHGYYQISDTIIWKTIEIDLLPLREKVLKVIHELQ
jgi:uncharacterized protein with HEPN domain